MRSLILVMAALLGSCTTCPRPSVGLGTPKVADQARGLPQTYVDASKDLLDLTQERRCQVVFEPAFSSRHAVWFIHDGAAGDATVFVRVLAHDGVQSFSARLDHGTAVRLSQLCLTALTADFASCEPHGRDGVWYHAAHPRVDGSYAMASFWTPRRGTVAAAFVKVAEALRSYATQPEALRAQEWIRIQDAAGDLSKRLANPSAG